MSVRQSDLVLELLRTQAALFPLVPRRDHITDPVRLRSMELLDDLFFDLVAAARPDRFVEAGAHEADASRRAVALVPELTAQAFEASPVTHAHFAERVDYASRRIDYVNAALTDRPRRVRFHDISTAERIVGHGSLLERVDGEGGVPVEVDGVRLDDVVREGRVAMWVDVEGATAAVLAGGPAVLARCDVVKVEVEDSPFWEGQPLAAEVLELLLAAGLLPVARDVQSRGQYNVVAVSPRVRDLAGVGARLETFLHEACLTPTPALLDALRAQPLYGRLSRLVRGGGS